jgi:DNA-binding NarL/FixJ family response regulator
MDKTRELQTPIRVFLANQPRLVRQMLRRAIQRTPDLQVVGESGKADSILDVPEEMPVDWLIVSLTEQGTIPQQFLHLLERYPSLRVLGISLDGNELALEDGLSGEKRQLSDVSLTTLISLLQEKVSH